MMQRLGKSPLNQTIAHFPSQLLCSLFPIQLRRLFRVPNGTVSNLLSSWRRLITRLFVSISFSKLLLYTLYQTQISGRNRVHMTLFPLSDLLQIASNGTIVFLSHRFRKLATAIKLASANTNIDLDNGARH